MRAPNQQIAGAGIVTLAARIDRRSFLATGTALVVGMSCAVGRAAAQPAGSSTRNAAPLNAWVRIGADDGVTIILSQAEIGQGVSTTLPAILADALRADWARLTVEAR